MKNKLLIILIILSVSGCSLPEKDTNKKVNINVPYNNYIKVKDILPHDPSSFTEGLFFYNGKLYESSGLYEKSEFYLNINLENGIPEKTIKINDDIFAEGSIILNDKIYIY